MTGAGMEEATVKTKLAEPVPVTLLAEMATLKTPSSVGLPVMAPVLGLTFSPAGRPVAAYEVGLPEAVI